MSYLYILGVSISFEGFFAKKKHIYILERS